MGKLIKFYNQNRHKVWLVIAIAIGVIALIQTLNTQLSGENNTNTTNNETEYSSNLNSNYSVVTGQEIKLDVKSIIDDFISLCNNGQVEEAYELLSDDCKETLYPTIDDFNTKYYSRVFSKTKSYICQAWIAEDNVYTYKIDFTEDMLATGSSSKGSIVDYYTIVKVDGEYKLNINKFIGSETINSAKTSDNVTINVKSRTVYMDYETYNIEVTNNSTRTMTLDDLQSSDQIYVEDKNGKQYSWYNHEILEEELVITRGISNKELSIKFNKSYQANNSSVKIVFSNIVLDSIGVISMEIEL